ncbi:MAG: hypothetical protein K8R18_07810 [Parvibaculum sp.]|uniref:hypothetical protein n=1 Tax=Parvibaculum sp. TaxID=2024848 RepID=UPI0025CBDB6E|nr:hypothetical protein [Parvibaculum sp.]MCE9649513.1 hypothetical protein [Parvibaculum sp.]
MATPAFAGAWPQAPGALQIIVPFTSTRATEAYDSDGKSQRRNRYTKEELAPYIEYGLTGGVTLVGNVALTHERSSWIGKTIADRSVSRIEAGARFALGTWQETFFSIQPLLAWHGAESPSDPFASRRGDIDGEIDLTMGQNFKWLGMDGFTDNMIGIRIRPANRPSELKANLTIGVRPFERTMLMLKSESYVAFSRGGGPTPANLQSNKLGLSFVRELDKTVSMELNGMASISGRNTIKERSLGFALWYRF